MMKPSRFGKAMIQTGLGVLFAARVHGQAMDHHHEQAGTTSAAAAREIARVQGAIVPLGRTGAAQAAGFDPVLGWIPTMGVHWVNRTRMQTGRDFDMTQPSQLMFSKVAGKDSLVGAAYAYFAPASDSARPATFDGAPAWHEHANLAPPGQTLVMLHVWFVPSPDGPFAGTNPNLPFWALGLSVPDSVRMHDAAFSARVKRAALALSLVADSTSILPMVSARPLVRAVLVPQRDSVGALVGELRAASDRHDTARWDRAIDAAAAHWGTMYDAYLASASTPNGRTRIERHIAMLLGEHAH